MNFSLRRDKLRRLLKQHPVESMLITNFVNVRYLTGFSGDSSYLLVTRDASVLISDERYTTQLEEECPDLELLIRGPGTRLVDFATQAIAASGVREVAYEEDSMTVALSNQLASSIGSARLVGASGLVESLRCIKDRDEIARTRVACDLARRTFEALRARLTPETTELEAAADLEYQARRFGAKGLSFPPIVGVGPRAALPHGSPTARRFGESEFTLVDWGVNEGSYMSDLTRILTLSKISPKLRKLYDVVLQAQLAGIAAVRPGASCEEVDRAARQKIEKAGYGKQFGHGLGHGIGLEIHEAPRLAQGQAVLLQPGMIVTVEPGVYLPGWGGIRIEDDVLVTRDGGEVLTHVPKELELCAVG